MKHCIPLSIALLQAVCSARLDPPAVNLTAISAKNNASRLECWQLDAAPSSTAINFDLGELGMASSAFWPLARRPMARSRMRRRCNTCASPPSTSVRRECPAGTSAKVIPRNGRPSAHPYALLRPLRRAQRGLNRRPKVRVAGRGRQGGCGRAGTRHGRSRRRADDDCAVSGQGESAAGA